MPWLRRYSPTKLCDGARMANFWRFFLRPVFQRATWNTFQTCILNSHWDHIMCGSTIDIQSATAENRRGKRRKTRKKKKPQLQNVMSASATRGGHWENNVLYKHNELVYTYYQKALHAYSVLQCNANKSFINIVNISLGTHDTFKTHARMITETPALCSPVVINYATECSARRNFKIRFH